MEEKWKNYHYMLGRFHSLIWDIEFAFGPVVLINRVFELEEFFKTRIFEVYNGEGRHYHTLKHILYMLDNLEDFSSYIKYNLHKNEVKLKIAIWFHDVIYNSKNSDNEEQSAIVAREFCELIKLKEKNIKEIEKLIISTKHITPPKNKLQKIICDLDLRGFSEYPQEKVTEEVRKEYSHLDYLVFLKGRKMFLNSLLNKKFIYNTRVYRDTLEAQARYKIKMELYNITQKNNYHNEHILKK